MYNTEVFGDTPPTSWNVVFEEMTLPDGQSNEGRVQAYDGPIHIADAANYLMYHKPDLGITSPYELNQAQYDAALDLLRAQRTLVSRYWHDAFIQMDDFKNEGVVASGSWPFQVNILQGEGAAHRHGHPGRRRDRLGRYHDDACRRRPSQLRLPVDGAFAGLEPAIRPVGLVRRQPVGAGGLYRRARHADGRGLHHNGLDDFDQIKFWTTPVSRPAKARANACPIIAGSRLYRGDRRPLIGPAATFLNCVRRPPAAG